MPTTEAIRERRRLANERWRRRIGKRPRVRPLIDRLMEKRRVTESGCWEWAGAVGLKGYATTTTGKRGQREYVHRIAYRLLVGPIPEGLEMDHLCRNRRRFNPEHLEAVTRQVNTLRGDGPSLLAVNTRARWNSLSPEEKIAQAQRASRGRWPQEIRNVVD